MSDYALPPEESPTHDGSEEYDLEALKQEAYEIVKAKIEAEGGFVTELGPSGSEDAKEGASLCVDDGAYAEAGRAYDGDVGEGARQGTLSSSGEGMAKVDAGDYREGKGTSRWGGGLGARFPETSSEEETSGGVGTLPTPVLETLVASLSTGMRPRVTNGGNGKAGNRDDGKESEEEEATSIIEACVIGGGVATDNDVRTEVATDMTSGSAETLPTPVLETPAASLRAGVRPRVMDGGGKAGNRNDEEEDARPGTRISKGTKGEASSSKTEWKKNGAGAGEPSPNRRRAGKAEIVWSNPYRPVTLTEES